MTDLDLIKDLEQHAGFVIDRLTCDGNVYADEVDLNMAYGAKSSLAVCFNMLRQSLKKIDASEKTFEKARSSMNSFNISDWSD